MNDAFFSNFALEVGAEFGAIDVPDISAFLTVISAPSDLINLFTRVASFNKETGGCSPKY